jgi:alanine racemase
VSLSDFLRALRAFPSIRIAGLMTHLSTADADAEYVAEQIAAFRRAEGLVRRFGHEPSVLHAANSAAVFRHPETHFDWVRPGISMYGYSGSASVNVPLLPAMRWRTEVLRIRTLRPGESAGYGRSFRATRDTLLATIPIGYGDGLLRSASNRGHVLIRGTRCPIVGNIAMDLTTVDVSGVPEVAIGDEAVLLGEQGREALDARDLAVAAGTIPYEVLTNVSRRVPRIYRGG